MSSFLYTQSAIGNNTQRPKLSEIPGARWIIAALYLNVLFAGRAVLYYFGFNVPLRLLSQIYGVVFVMLIILGLTQFHRATRGYRLATARHLFALRTWCVLCTIFALVGMVVGNMPTEVGKEWIWMITVALLSYIFVDDNVDTVLFRHLTVLFYVAVPFVFFFYEVPSVVVTGEDVYSDVGADISNRYINTIGFDLRFLLSTGAILGVYGLVSAERKAWRIMQIAAFFIYFGFDIILFKFRGSAINLVILVASVIILRPFYDGELKIKHSAFLLVLILPAAAWFFTSEEWTILQDRFQGRDTNQSTFDSRIAEATIYFSEMEWGALVGRGLGGTFDVSEAMSVPRAEKWGTLHFGILVFTLKGGGLLLVSFLALVLQGFTLRPRSWYKSSFNLVAALYFPAMFLSMLLNPFAMQHDFAISYVALSFVIARYGKAYECSHRRGLHLRPVPIERRTA